MHALVLYDIANVCARSCTEKWGGNCLFCLIASYAPGTHLIWTSPAFLGGHLTLGARAKLPLLPPPPSAALTVLLHSTMPLIGSTWFYSTVIHSTTGLLCSTWLCYTLLQLYLALLDSTWLYHTLPWLYLALLHSTWLFYTLLCLHILGSILDFTQIYCTVPWLYLTP